MADNIKVGDVVELKSGGPKMTVGINYDAITHNCHWFVDEEAKSDVFPLASLSLVEKTESS